MDVDDTIELKSDKSNHKSALGFPDDDGHYLAEESQHKAITKQPPFENMHFSPFITSERRVIVDLSWPDGHAGNTGVVLDVYMGTE